MHPKAPAPEFAPQERGGTPVGAGSGVERGCGAGG